MTWLPIGPDFVFTPRNGNFNRLSRRNEYGRQGFVGGAGQIGGLAIDPLDPQTIYVVERPSSGGSTVFRTRTGGRSWEPIADSLQRADARIDPNAIAINPVLNSRVYLATWSDRGVYVSTDRGNVWGSKNTIPAAVRKLLVDPNTAGTPGAVVIYAATPAGVYRSPDEGATWTEVLAGDVWSLVAHIPASGTPHFYAGVYREGVFHTSDPTAGWSNLNTQGIGLPAHTATTTEEPEGNFNAVLVDLCRRDPSRLYVWTTKQACDATGSGCRQVTADLYTSSSPLSTWSTVPTTSPPGPSYGFYNCVFAVATNSPGDGSNDVLFFGSVNLHRSIDGGRTWEVPGDWHHADYHSFAFFPETPAAGVVPAIYMGNDGGLSVSTGFCDRTAPFAAVSAHFNEGLAYADTPVFQNLDHGMQASALYQYNSHPAIAALSYIGCQDTGVNGGAASLGWRGMADADAGAIAVAPGSDGVKVWGIWGAFGGWPSFYIHLWTDTGEPVPGVVAARLGSGGPLLNGTSNYVVGLDGKCLAGVRVRDSERTLSTALTATGSQTVTPSSMNGIGVGTVVVVDPGGDEEVVTVTATTATSFTATFAKTHASGVTLRLQRAFVVRIDQAAIATQISQDLGASDRRVEAVAASPTDPDLLCVATWVPATGERGVWRTTAGSTAGSSTVWTEIATDKPAGAEISSITIDSAGKIYVLLRSPVTTGGEFGVTSPLFEVSSGAWVHQQCSGLPTNTAQERFGKLVADPAATDVLYASHGARVYRLALSGGVWAWSDISEGLPGPWIYDLWIGDVALFGSDLHRVLLRAGVPTRGIWEREVTAGAETAPGTLYLRDNLLDHGWLPRSIEGAPHPYEPTRHVWHYQCADIKIDARQPGSGSVPSFFQTDPEGSTLPITHVLFDQLQDNSSNLPGGDRAMVHAQVHHRSAVPLDNVRAWAIYCNAAAGVPALNVSPSLGNAFPFWSQFTVTGDIVPALPVDSPWRSVGSPRTLSGLDASHPQVASWEWTVPLLPSGDPGHYCMVVFLHSAARPIYEASFDVDEMTPRNRQVGQKNLHIGPPLPAGGEGGGGAPGGGGPGGQPGARVMEEIVEFHNPGAAPRQADLIFDLTALPSPVEVSFQLTAVDTAAPLAESIDGVARHKRVGVAARLWRTFASFFRWLGRLVQWLGCWLENLGRWLAGMPLRRCRVRPEGRVPRFEDTVYEAAPSARVEVRGVRLPAYGSAAARLSIRNRGALEPGSAHAFEVQQVVGGRVVGGSTYVMRAAGLRKLHPPEVFPPLLETRDPAEVERIELEAEEQRYVPPWARDLIEERERELGRKLS